MLEIRILELVNIDSMQFGFVLGRRTRDVLFLVPKVQEEYQYKKKKLCMCFVDIKKVFDRIPIKVMKWAMRKNGLPKVIARAMISFYHGAKMKVRVGSELSKE